MTGTISYCVKKNDLIDVGSDEGCCFGVNTIYGGKGDDFIRNAAANSLIYGGSGNDRIEAIDAGGTIKGGSGDDEILASGEAIYTIYGDRGDDRIIVGTDVENTTFGGSGNDYLEATFGENPLW